MLIAENLNNRFSEINTITRISGSDNLTRLSRAHASTSSA